MEVSELLHAPAALFLRRRAFGSYSIGDWNMWGIKYFSCPSWDSNRGFLAIQPLASCPQTRQFCGTRRPLSASLYSWQGKGHDKVDICIIEHCVVKFNDSFLVEPYMDKISVNSNQLVHIFIKNTLKSYKIPLPRHVSDHIWIHPQGSHHQILAKVFTGSWSESIQSVLWLQRGTAIWKYAST